jgi:hypothetical protein
MAGRPSCQPQVVTSPRPTSGIYVVVICCEVTALRDRGGFGRLEGSALPPLFTSEVTILLTSLRCCPCCQLQWHGLGCGGEGICVRLRPQLCHSSEGDICYAHRSGYGDMSILGPFRAGTGPCCISGN